MPIIRFEITDSSTAAGINEAVISIRPAIIAPGVTANVGGTNGVWISPILGPRSYRVKVEAPNHTPVEENMDLSGARYADPPGGPPLQLKFPLDLEPITPEKRAHSYIAQGFQELGNVLNELEVSIEQSDMKESEEKIKESNGMIEDLRNNLAGYVNLPEYANMRTAFANLATRQRDLQQKAKDLKPRGLSLAPTKKRFGIPVAGGKKLQWQWPPAIFAGLVVVIFTFVYFVYLFGPLNSLVGGISAFLAFILLLIPVGLGSYFGFNPLLEAFSQHLPNVIMGGIITILTYILIGIPLVNSIPIIRDAFILKWIVIPGIIFTIVTISSNQGRAGFGKTIAHSLIWTVIGILALAGLKFFTTGAAFDIDSYINSLNALRIVGVSQETIGKMQDGIRNTLSFLQFKAAEPAKPEAKKIGGFEAIRFKFGTRHNNYLFPTLFARMNYTFPVSVSNPNSFDTNLVVKDFALDEIYLKDGSSRILCGSTQDGSGKISLDDIAPEIEKTATIDFVNKADCREIWAKAVGQDPANATPMYPAKVKFFLAETEKKECQETAGGDDSFCVNILRNYYSNYFKGDATKSATSNDVWARYIGSENMCECKINRYYNTLDDLCLFEKTAATITLKSNYNFNVQGKGELILVKNEQDIKLAPKPSITSSAGPLTITAYFVSDVHVFGQSGVGRTTKMFIDVKNDGAGAAGISNAKINGKGTPVDVGGITIERCSPELSGLFIGSGETATAVCDVRVESDSSIVTGAYKTIPVIVDMEYEYSQSHSASVGIKKEIIPEGVSGSDEVELKKRIEVLPYYCPPDLKIYSDQATQTQQHPPPLVTQPTPTPEPTPSECNQNVQDADGNKLSCRTVSGVSVKLCCFEGQTDEACKSVHDNEKSNDPNAGTANYCNQRINGWNGYCINGQGECLS